MIKFGDISDITHLIITKTPLARKSCMNNSFTSCVQDVFNLYLNGFLKTSTKIFSKNPFLGPKTKQQITVL